MRSALLLSLISTSVAFQFPFKVPFFQTQLPLQVGNQYVSGPHKIAIIGAGAGGSSAAFWIAKAKERFGLDVQVDVYEKASYIGGRTTTVYPHDNKSLPAVELGASIFVKANKNLWRAAETFNLTLNNFDDEDDHMGIWDGEKLILDVGNGWWDTAKIIWRYGINAPRRTQSIVDTMVKEYLGLYSHDAPKWDNITSLASALGWTDLVSSTTSEYFRSHGVSDKFINEMVESATRVNYGQNADQIHALEGACSLAATGASQVKGGNWQIFEHFLKYSNATVHLNTQVTQITHKSSSHPWIIHSDKGAIAYKAVILAAPLHQTGIDLPPGLVTQVPDQPYVHLHVTLLTTNSPQMNPEYFSMPPSAKIPAMMLTTYDGVRKGGKAPEFNSVSYHNKIDENERVVKIFSEERVSDEWLQNAFSGQVSWVYRKEWDAYPKLPPTTSFAPVKLENGFYYVNAFEPFISTMETETLASRNVVELLLNEEFNSSLCGPRISASGEKSESRTKADDDFVYGWDC
ncbi:prenylcysteine lyase [Moniliophthora roreri MCA 2997]|uniref:Prenylcysteine lyase n=1 Tax=Moniliophthora roreri (strain MCA 2997) TaxID=1381753 RepID=V2XZF4_MONRO|nr:prenylcysteine lyase [Moniliophthora roreri MCA 2997]